MARSPLLSNIGSLLSAWFGAAAAATLALVVMFVIQWGLRDLGTLLPTALLAFMFASFCALPVVFLLVIVLLAVRRFLPILIARPLAITLLLAVLGALAGGAIGFLFVGQFISAADVTRPGGVAALPLLSGAIGGVVLGALMARPKLLRM